SANAEAGQGACCSGVNRERLPGVAVKKNPSKEERQGLTRTWLHSRCSSAAGAAERRKYSEAPGCGPGRVVCSMYSKGSSWGILERGVAGRPFGLVRFDLLLQIGPSVPCPRACYVLRPRPLITSFLPARRRGAPRDCARLNPCYGGLMSALTGPTPQRTGSPSPRIGVGIDPSRYGHYAAFLRHALHPAADELSFAESAQGYGQLQKRLEQLALRHPDASFAIRLDIAGQYADNLLHFLHQLADPSQPQAGALAKRDLTISCGDPQRNKNYRAAHFGAKKSDAVEARACARFAVNEGPAPTPVLAPALRVLRQVAARLQAVVRQRTRLINQLHQLLAASFP